MFTYSLLVLSDSDYYRFFGEVGKGISMFFESLRIGITQKCEFVYIWTVKNEPLVKLQL